MVLDENWSSPGLGACQQALGLGVAPAVIWGWRDVGLEGELLRQGGWGCGLLSGCFAYERQIPKQGVYSSGFSWAWEQLSLQDQQDPKTSEPQKVQNMKNIINRKPL